MVVVSGAAFMSNFEVQASISDNGSEKNYSNYKICENLLRLINPVQITPIAEVQAQTEDGYKYTIEGVVTSNASGYDKGDGLLRLHLRAGRDRRHQLLPRGRRLQDRRPGACVRHHQLLSG